MANFTVVGYYPDNNQLYMSWFEADTWLDALDKCRAKIKSPVVVTAVLAGAVTPADELCEIREIIPESGDE